MMFTRSARHLTDGELLRLLDADAPADELTRLDAHAATCPRCADALRSLRHAGEVVHARLQVVQPPALEYAPTLAAPAGMYHRTGASGRVSTQALNPLWNRGWARAAVLLLAIAGALVSVQPLRARINGWVDAAWAQLAGSHPVRVSALARPAAPASTGAASSRLWFTPAGSELRVALSARQAAGALVLERAVGPSASLEILPGDVTVVPMASERLLEIRNRATASSSYLVRVPATVRSVIVLIGGEAPRAVAAGALDVGVRVQLGPAAGLGAAGAASQRPAPATAAPVRHP